MIAWILWWWRWLFPVKDKYPETAQEIFDFVVRKLREQGRRCVSDGRCVFRGPNGLKCAVGHLIPDDKYDPRMDLPGTEECSIIHVANVIGLRAHGDLLQALQLAHDASWLDYDCHEHDHRKLCQGLTAIASGHNLNPQVAQDWLDSLPA